MNEYLKPELAQSLKEAFKELPDPRAENTVHPLINIIVIALVAMIAGANDYTEFEEFGESRKEWLGNFLDVRTGIPSHDTFGRVFARLNPVRWQSCLVEWVRYALGGKLIKGDVIGLDGKCLRGTHDDDERATYLVNAWSTALGISLAQVKVNAKSNEITALPDLIETLDLFDVSGCTLTLDAMGTQREIARLVMEKEANYVVALKDNQPKLSEDVKWLFEDAFKQDFLNRPYSYTQTQEYGHGREELRRCWVLSELSYLEPHQWPGLQSVVLIERHRKVQGVTSMEQRYYLSSLMQPASVLLTIIRAHWQVENSLHWVLDVIFNEDKHRARKDHAPANLGMLRQLALNLLKHTPPPKPNMSLKNLRKRAGWDSAFLEQILDRI
jgi:predicted transposase YbfD/YdcC